MPKKFEKEFISYCENQDLEVNSNQITVIKKLILIGEIANQANNKLLEAAIKDPKNKDFIVPNL